MAIEETKKKKNNESKEDKEVVLEDPRDVLGIIALASDSDNNSSNHSSCSSCSSDDKPSSLSSPFPNTSKNVLSSYSSLPWNKMIDCIKKKSIRKFSLTASYEQTRKNLWRKQRSKPEVSFPCEHLLMAKPSWRNFTYQELAKATNDFSPDKVIGEGGHAEVFRGVLADGEIVAIKKLKSEDKTEEQKVSDFLSELGIIAHVNHPNAARLLGFSCDQDLYFVLEYSPYGSLANLIFEADKCLEWKIRYKVILDIADGLNYLHNACPRRIIHRDLNAYNVLINRDYEAQIADFGLAKWLPDNWSNHVVSHIVGTFGYMAPEYMTQGIVDERTDVFAFGVLLLEIITSRRAVDHVGTKNLIEWAKPFLEKNSIKDIVDPQLRDKYDPIEIKRVMLTASMCIHRIAVMRPTMTLLVQLLRGEDGPAELKQKPSERGVSANVQQEHSSFSYLDELIRQKQALFEYARNAPLPEPVNVTHSPHAPPLPSPAFGWKTTLHDVLSRTSSL